MFIMGKWVLYVSGMENGLFGMGKLVLYVPGMEKGIYIYQKTLNDTTCWYGTFCSSIMFVNISC